MADPPSGSTAFVLSGGGTKGSFEVGALQYLIGTERIVPDIITATSAGAIAAAVLAQARTLSEFDQRAQEIEDDILAMTRTDQVFGEQAWLRALKRTTLAEEIRFALTQGTRPPLPALDGAEPGVRSPGGLEAPSSPRAQRRLVRKGRRRSRHKTARLVGGAALRLPSARRKVQTSGSSVLNLQPLADAIRHGNSSGIRQVDPALIRRPGLQLRLAVTALRAGVLRYVTESGTIVEDDAVTPAPGPAAGPVDVLEGTLASASVPIVFPPRRLADDDYVDGGVLQVIPVRAAAQLGAARIFAVVAIPLQIIRDEHDFAHDTAANIGLRALGAITMADRQHENLAVPLPSGTTLTVIDPVVDVVGFFEVEPGLLRINRDYGWLRAADATASGDEALQASAEAHTHHIARTRVQAWHLEEKLWDPELAAAMTAGTLALIRECKSTIRDGVCERKQLGYPVPDGCEAWWTEYEVHRTARPPSLPALGIS